MVEAHFAVPGAGAVLHTVNTRLAAADVTFQLEHAESRFLLVDTAFMTLATDALALMDSKHRPTVIHIQDASAAVEGGSGGGGSCGHAMVQPATYEELIAAGAKIACNQRLQFCVSERSTARCPFT